MEASSAGKREYGGKGLDAFGLLDFTMLRPVLAWRAFWNLWHVYFFNFLFFFRAAVNSGYLKPRILNQWIREHDCIYSTGWTTEESFVRLHTLPFPKVFLENCPENEVRRAITGRTSRPFHPLHTNVLDSEFNLATSYDLPLTSSLFAYLSERDIMLLKAIPNSWSSIS
jgi:hypothetical protein